MCLTDFSGTSHYVCGENSVFQLATLYLFYMKELEDCENKKYEYNIFNALLVQFQSLINAYTKKLFSSLDTLYLVVFSFVGNLNKYSKIGPRGL